MMMMMMMMKKKKDKKPTAKIHTLLKFKLCSFQMNHTKANASEFLWSALLPNLFLQGHRQNLQQIFIAAIMKGGTIMI
jgi:hypothetical protein